MERKVEIFNICVGVEVHVPPPLHPHFKVICACFCLREYGPHRNFEFWGGGGLPAAHATIHGDQTCKVLQAFFGCVERCTHTFQLCVLCTVTSSCFGVHHARDCRPQQSLFNRHCQAFILTPANHGIQATHFYVQLVQLVHNSCTTCYKNAYNLYNLLTFIKKNNNSFYFF